VNARPENGTLGKRQGTKEQNACGQFFAYEDYNRGMQDPAAFFRQRAIECFWRRRLYPINSEDWKDTVRQARMFIRGYRGQARRKLPISEKLKP